MSDAPIKAVHIYIATALMVVTAFWTAGRVGSQIGEFKTETATSFRAIGVKVDGMAGQLGEVSRVTQENRDWIMKRTGAEEAADESHQRGSGVKRGRMFEK